MSWWKKLVKKVQGADDTSAPAVASGGKCDHSNIELRQGTAEFEWFIARGELETTGNLAHGASHLANLLSYGPGNPPWVELLERYLAAACPNPETLIPRGEKLYYTTEAMRAYIWHSQGRLEEAVDLLVNVTQAKGETRYLEAWVLPWLETPGTVESLSEQSGLQLFALVLGRFPEAALSPVPQLHDIQRWARLGQRFFRQKGGDGMAKMLCAGMLRKAGLFEDALAIIRPELARMSNWHLATALGLILRAQGNCTEAEAAFKLALQIDPSDVSARLEAGDMYFDRQQWRPALAWYENALQANATHPWALPSAQFCRWKMHGDEPPLHDMTELARQGNDRARDLYYRAVGYGLPEPVDATANILRQFRESLLEKSQQESASEETAASKIGITLSSLEAPSNFLAFRLEMEALARQIQLEVAVENIPEPDPRWPAAGLKYLLWNYEGTEASPALPAPGADVVDRIAALAATDFREQANWAAASRVAEQLGPQRVVEVLAVMVYPPPVPQGRTALAWLPRVQLAAAQVAGQMDEGWHDSARRAALLSVLLGPSDWATNAAIRVLARLGTENEAIAPDIHEAFQQLADRTPTTGYCCWQHTLYSCWRELPHLFPNERAELEKKLREIESDE